MSEFIEITSVLDAPAKESTAIVSNGYLQNSQAAYNLNGKNYLKWSRLVRILKM